MTRVIDQRRFLATEFGHTMPYWRLDRSYRRGFESGSLGNPGNPYTGAEAVSWLRGYYEASHPDETKH